MSVRHIALCSVSILWIFTGIPAAAQSVDPFALLFENEDPDIDAGEDDTTGQDDLDIITFKLRDLTLDDGFAAYRTEGGYCLPFKNVVELFEFKIDISDDDLASGWFISTHRELIVDFPTAVVTLSGDNIELPQNPFSQTEDGWCGTTEALSAIFPITFEYDARHLRVIATPQEILPVEERLEREAYREQVLGLKAQKRTEYPLAKNPYRWMSWPVADIGVDISTSSQGKVSVNFDLEAAGDILKTTGRFRTVGGGNTGILDNLRVTLGRNNVDAKELGPLKARQFNLGDISTPNQPLISKAVNGAGVVITNRSSFKADLFDTTEIRGALPIGWEAELYAGEELVAFTTTRDSNGDYVFQDVTLKAGYNRFTVKLFGPYGEKDIHEIKYFIGSELEPENEMSYFLGVINGKKPFVETIGLAQKQSNETNALDEESNANSIVEATDISDLFDESFGNNDETQNNVGDDGLMVTGSVSRGLSDKLTVRIDGTLGLDSGNRHKSAGVVSVASSVLGGFGVGRVATNGKGRPAVETAFQRKLFERSNISVRAVDFGGLENDVAGYGDNRTQRLARVRGNTFINFGKRSVPMLAEVSYSESVNGSRYLEAMNRTSGTWKHFRLTNTLQYSRADARSESSSNLGGALLFSRKHKGTRFLGGIGYQLTNGAGLTNVGISAQRELKNDNVGSLSLTHSMEKNDTSLSGSWSKPFKRATVSAGGSIDMRGQWTAGVRLGFSLSKSKDRMMPTLMGRSDLSRNGSIRAQVFIDENADGLFNEGEQPVARAQLIVNESIRKAETGENGILLLDKISTESVQNVSISLSSLDDPFLIPSEPGRAYLLRPGQVVPYQIALQSTGDAEGYLMVQRGEQSLGAAGIPIQARDMDGNVVAETKTDFDGYFYLDKLPLKKLKFHVPKEAVGEANVAFKDLPFELTIDEPSLFGAELIVYAN